VIEVGKDIKRRQLWWHWYIGLVTSVNIGQGYVPVPMKHIQKSRHYDSLLPLLVVRSSVLSSRYLVSYHISPEQASNRRPFLLIEVTCASSPHLWHGLAQTSQITPGLRCSDTAVLTQSSFYLCVRVQRTRTFCIVILVPYRNMISTRSPSTVSSNHGEPTVQQR